MTLPVAIDAERQALNAIVDATDVDLDAIIVNHIHDAIAVGAALTVRRDRGTWKEEGFKRWEEFCQVRYGISRTTAWREIRAAKATAELPPGATPVSQRKATRPTKQAAAPIEARSTDTTPPPPPHPTPSEGQAEGVPDSGDPAPEEVPAERGTPMYWTPLDVLAALLELDPQALADLIPVDERRETAKEMRRWSERFEIAARGLAAPKPRSELVTPRLKGS